LLKKESISFEFKITPATSIKKTPTKINLVMDQQYTGDFKRQRDIIKSESNHHINFQNIQNSARVRNLDLYRSPFRQAADDLLR
jgi:hypothetical protein